MPAPRCVHVDLDGAWPREALPEAEYVGLRAWGPKLRYSTTRQLIDAFAELLPSPWPPFTLFGSGDFHHLTTIWLRRFDHPFTLVSFDNHPDWDIRPPRWGCGTWLSRALESPLLQFAAVWGCGNFEFNWPHSLFANRAALGAGRLQARPWQERLRPRSSAQWPTISSQTWRAEFHQFAQSIASRQVYVTVDLDCLREEEAATNWENGLFSAADVAWAIRELRQHVRIAGGDVCGAYSAPRYARLVQRIEAALDHPKLDPVDSETASERNLRSLAVIWPALSEESVVP